MTTSIDGSSFAGALAKNQVLRILLIAARTPRGSIGLGVSGTIVLLAIIGPFVAPYTSTEFVGSPYALPAINHLLGTDNLGRDVLSRVLHGGWILLFMASAATLIAIVLGTAFGIAAAYLRSLWDSLIMRSIDVLLAFPQLVFALLLVAIIGRYKWLIVLAIGLTHFPQVARVIRGASLDIAERDYVKASESIGMSRLHIMARDILPGLVAPLMVELGLRLTYSIIFMAGLSFLGLGQQPPSPGWGVMINENRLGMTLNAYSVLAPAILLGLLTIGVNTFTDAVSRATMSDNG